MSKINYTMSLTAGAQMDLSAGINAQVLPLLSQAVKAIAKQTQQDWQTAVLKAKLWSGEKDAYASSINWSMTGDFSAMIETDYKYAQEIETGRPARDLKQMLNTSHKVRRTNDGRRFLVIPMRHGTPGTNKNPMPSGVGKLAKAMAPSRVTSMGERPSGQVTVLSPKTGMHAAAKQSPFLSNPKTKQAAMVASRNYAWGERLSAGALKQAGMTAPEVKKYAGMVRMDASTPGGGKSSQYLSFKIMMEGSSGWVIGPRPGLFIAKKVTEEMQPKAQAAFAEAIKRTIGG